MLGFIFHNLHIARIDRGLLCILLLFIVVILDVEPQSNASHSSAGTGKSAVDEQETMMSRSSPLKKFPIGSCRV
jgi:hypothetical protein